MWRCRYHRVQPWRTSLNELHACKHPNGDDYRRRNNRRPPRPLINKRESSTGGADASATSEKSIGSFRNEDGKKNNKTNKQTKKYEARERNCLLRLHLRLRLRLRRLCCCGCWCRSKTNKRHHLLDSIESSQTWILPIKMASGIGERHCSRTEDTQASARSALIRISSSLSVCYRFPRIILTPLINHFLSSLPRRIVRIIPLESPVSNWLAISIWICDYLSAD